MTGAMSAVSVMAGNLFGKQLSLGTNSSAPKITMDGSTGRTVVCVTSMTGLKEALSILVSWDACGGSVASQATVCRGAG
jgi:hypothetical protein